ncbi:MAG: ribosomal RNA small subunit methyltransferase A [Lentisphaerae bacterium]|nr:ribosomal RNA small subunit methyltransferase A [Lentisphaerota bacterium]
MNKSELLAQLEKLNMRPGRGLGQNFLLDNNLLEFIARSANIMPGEVVLEVGPGFGALTEKLLAYGAELYAVEFDHRVCEFLRANHQESNFHLTEGDGCRVDYAQLLGAETPFRAIANLPYAVSSVLIARFLELPNPPQQMIFMLQKEMGERLAAQPGKGSYGALSVRVQQLYDVKILRIVPPEVFYPAPAVDSALVAFDRKADFPAPEARKKLEKVVKLAFLNRRKQLGKVLKQHYSEEAIRAALAEVGHPWEIRPEKITVQEFEKLANLLNDR